MAASQQVSKPFLQLAVAGAHLSGLHLNHQLTEIGAKLVCKAYTAPVYRLYSLGPKPALIRQPEGTGTGASIEVEVWELPIDKVGAFLRDGVTAPLGIGDVLLEDNSTVKGFIGEGYGVVGAEDITRYAGWRAYLAAKRLGEHANGGGDATAPAAAAATNGTAA